MLDPASIFFNIKKSQDDVSIQKKIKKLKTLVINLIVFSKLS
jgi:hypothetical protein